MKSFLFSLLMLLSWSSGLAQDCELVHLKSYYFPYAEFTAPVVYKYTDQTDSSRIQYWHMQTQIEGSDTVLITHAFTVELELMEIFKEKIGPTGCSMIEFTMVQNGDSTKTEHLETSVYSWYSYKNEKITWAVSYTSKGVTRETQKFLSKTRALQYRDEPRSFDNQSLATVRFRDNFELRTGTSSGTTQDYLFYQYSFYTETVGLTGYERIFSDGFKVNFQLEEILTEKKWNKLLKKAKR